MGSYLAAVWRCRYFWLSLVKMDLRTRYRRSVLGMGWSLLQPIAIAVILSVSVVRLSPVAAYGEGQGEGDAGRWPKGIAFADP